MPRTTLLLLLVLLAPLSLTAQTLALDGVTGAVRVAPGATLSAELTGTPGALVWLAIGEDPGPSTIANLSVPLDLTRPFAFLLQGVPLPASGRLTLSAVLPSTPQLSGSTFHLAAILVAPSLPGGVAVTNAASFRFVDPGADAGPDTIALIGGAATLDGTASSLQGMPTWTMRSAPAGSAAVLSGSQTLTPFFRPDLPGRYVLELQTSGSGRLSVDTVLVQVWDLSVSSVSDGAFVTFDPLIRGRLQGPPGATVALGGAPVTIGFGGNFDAGTYPTTPGPNPVDLVLTAPSGEQLTRSITVIRGAGLPLGIPLSRGFTTRLAGGGVDAIEDLLEAQVAGFDINSILTALPTTTITNTFAFSARYRFTSASIDPNATVDLVPQNGFLQARATLRNVRAVARITGSIFGIGYTETATITASSALLTGDVTIAPDAAGNLQITLTNGNVNLQGFNFSVGSILNGIAQLGLIQSALESQVENALRDFLPLIPQELNPLLASLGLSASSGTTGLPFDVAFPFVAVAIDPAGVSFINRFQASVASPPAAAPAITASLFTADPPTPVPATTPFGNGAYDVGALLEDDLLNRLLAALARSGFLNAAIDPTGGPLGMPLTAQAASFLLPNAGFERFPAAWPVVGDITPTTAPTIGLVPGLANQGRLAFDGVRLTLDVLAPSGTRVPVLDVVLSLRADVDAVLAADLSTLSLNASNVTITGRLQGAIAGSNAAFLVGNLTPVGQFVLPQLLSSLQGLPLPALGINGTVLETSVSPSDPSRLGTWLDLP